MGIVSNFQICEIPVFIHTRSKFFNIQEKVWSVKSSQFWMRLTTKACASTIMLHLYKYQYEQYVCIYVYNSIPTIQSISNSFLKSLSDLWVTEIWPCG